MLILKNATLWPMTGQAPHRGDLAIADGKISAMGPDLNVPGAEIFDATGLYALPGFVDAHCHVGMWEDGMGEEGADGNEATHPSTPHMCATDGVNPRDPCFAAALCAGVTTVCTGPGSANVIGGSFCALHTGGAHSLAEHKPAAGNTVDNLTLVRQLAMKFALGENPKAVYGGREKLPMTRMGSAAILREQLQKAKQYRDKKQKKPDSPPDYDAALEALSAVFDGLPCKIHVHRADDIMTAIRLMAEFGLDGYTLDHCTEGYLIPDVLAAALAHPHSRPAMPILGPLVCDRSKIELKDLSMAAPGVLAAAGIPFAIMTDHPVTPIEYLPVCAALAVREGCDEEAALQAITANAAKAVGLDGQIGSLRPGLRADITLFDGHPLQFTTHAVRVYIDGAPAYIRP